MDPPPQHDELIKKITNEVIQEIEQDIEKQNISVGSRSADITTILEQSKHRKKKTNEPTKLTKLDLNGLQEMKQSKMVQIKEIERHQNILKRSTMLNTSNVTRSFSKLERSRFTEDELKVIKDIMKKQKQYAKTLREKEKKLAQWVEEKRNEEQELRKKQLAQRCQIVRQQLKEKREELERKKEERMVKLQQEIKALKELKEKKTLHQRMEEIAEKKMQRQQQLEYQRYQAEKTKKKVAVTDIQKHEKEYLEHKKQLQQKRGKHLEESRTFSKSQLPYIHSKIWTRIKQQQQQQMKIAEWQRNMKENNLSKQKVYSKNVKELFLPKLTTKPNADNIKEEIQLKRKPLKLDEQHMLGNNYMKSAHENITTELKEKQKKKSLDKVEEAGGYSAFYKNYLKDLKESRPTLDTHDMNSAAFQSMFSDSNEADEKKIKKAIKLIEMKDRKLNKSKDSEMVDSIKSKLAVLKQMIR